MNQEMLTIVWLAMIGVAMYFFMFRPQSKQKKARAAMMEALKKGDRILTVGGIYGIVRAIKGDRVTVEIATEVYVQFSKSAIGSVLKNEGKPASTAAEEPETLALDEADADEDYVIEQDEEQEQE